MSTVSHTLYNLKAVIAKRLSGASERLKNDAEAWMRDLHRGAEDVANGAMTPDRYRMLVEQARVSMQLEAANELAETERAMLSGLLDAALKISLAAI